MLQRFAIPAPYCDAPIQMELSSELTPATTQGVAMTQSTTEREHQMPPPTTDPSPSSAVTDDAKPPLEDRSAERVSVCIPALWLFESKKRTDTFAIPVPCCAHVMS